MFYNNKLHYSLDNGNNWTINTLSSLQRIFCIEQGTDQNGNNLFILVGGTGTGGAINNTLTIVKSTDGINWGSNIDISNNVYTINKIIFNGSTWVIVGSINHVGYGQYDYKAALWVSTDYGNNWTEIILDNNTPSNIYKAHVINDITYTGNRWICVGLSESTINFAFVRFSDDNCNTWYDASNQSGITNPGSITYVKIKNRLIVMGSVNSYGNNIYYSDDNGNNWIKSPGSVPNNGAQFWSHFNGSRIITGGYKWTNPGETNSLYSDDNGMSWYKLPNINDKYVILTIDSNGYRLFFACMSGIIMSDDNGLNQTKVYNNSTNFRRVNCFFINKK